MKESRAAFWRRAFAAGKPAEPNRVAVERPPAPEVVAVNRVLANDAVRVSGKGLLSQFFRAYLPSDMKMWVEEQRAAVAEDAIDVTLVVRIPTPRLVGFLRERAPK